MEERTHVAAMEFSRYARARARRERTARRAVSQNSAAWSTPRSTLILGVSGAGRPRSSTVRTPTEVIAPVFPRKEVIQPQLPLRLPCYDFTPVTDPTFDGFLPCGLEHRLRVLPASVV